MSASQIYAYLAGAFTATLFWLPIYLMERFMWTKKRRSGDA